MNTFRPLITATLLVLAAPALAKDYSSSIKFMDLDLNSPAGRETLDKRIDVAARQACSGIERTGSRVRTNTAANECKAEFRRQAIAQVPALRQIEVASAERSR